jgi:hypothetical protein
MWFFSLLFETFCLSSNDKRKIYLALCVKRENVIVGSESCWKKERINPFILNSLKLSGSYFKGVWCCGTWSFLQVSKFFFNNVCIFYSIWSILHYSLMDCISLYEQNAPLHIFLRVNIRRIAFRPADRVYLSIQILQTWTPVTWTYREGSISIFARLFMKFAYYFDAALKSVAISMLMS